MVYGAILTYSEEAALKKAKEIARNMKKMGLSREQIAQATQTDFPLEDTMLTSSEEAALKAEKQAKIHIAQKMIQKGWDSTDITETTGLDRETVESLMGRLRHRE